MSLSIKSWWIIVQLRAFVTNADDLLTRSMNWVYHFAFTPACWRLLLVVGTVCTVLGFGAQGYWQLHQEVLWLYLPSLLLIIVGMSTLVLRWAHKSEAKVREEFRRG